MAYDWCTPPYNDWRTIRWAIGVVHRTTREDERLDLYAARAATSCVPWIQQHHHGKDRRQTESGYLGHHHRCTAIRHCGVAVLCGAPRRLGLRLQSTHLGRGAVFGRVLDNRLVRAVFRTQTPRCIGRHAHLHRWSSGRQRAHGRHCAGTVDHAPCVGRGHARYHPRDRRSGDVLGARPHRRRRATLAEGRAGRAHRTVVLHARLHDASCSQTCCTKPASSATTSTMRPAATACTT